MSATSTGSAMAPKNRPKNMARMRGIIKTATVAVLLLCTFMQACKNKEGYEEEYTTLSAPTNVKAEQAEEGIKVSWDPVNGATQYYLYVKTANSYNFNKYDSTTDNYIVYKTDKNDSYGFYVCAYFYDGYGSISTGPQSETIYFTLDNPDNALHVPTGLTAKQVKERIYVSWDPVKMADKYMVEYSSDKSTRTADASSNEGFYIYNLTHGTKYSFRVRAYQGYVYTQWSEPVSCTYSAPGGGSASGLYMGVIGFYSYLNTKSIDLLVDNKNSYGSSFKSFINNSLEMKDGTSLYYAVDNAIDNLENAVLPQELTNVSIVTFTDGLDNASIERNNKYSTKEAYRDAIKARILGTKIGNLSINAYSVGLKGKDVVDNEAFHASLVAMASNENNAKEVSNMNEVNKTFSDIAHSLYNESRSMTLKLKIPGGADDGTKMRFTFDNVTDAAASNLYIEGTYKRNGTTRIFENVTYHGVNSSSGTTVTGSLSETFVTFSFNNFTGASTSNVKHWEYVASKNQWQPDSEFGQSGNVETTVESKSAVVMLVLDCTTSLGADFANMQKAANEFIDVLTQKK